MKPFPALLPVSSAGAEDTDSVRAIADLVQGTGTACHPHALRLIEMGRHAPREIVADTLHFLGLIHGRKPSLFEVIAEAPLNRKLPDWIRDAAVAAAGDRALLGQMVVAAGPVPSLGRQIQAEEAAGGTRRAFLTLARSDRFGCALGAGAALALDWPAVQQVTQALARALRIESTRRPWPTQDSILASLGNLAEGDARVSRALLFGARTLVSQNRTFWDLLETRAQEIVKAG